MKRVGTINGITVYEEPSCPPGQLYFLNEYNMYFRIYNIQISRWQKVKLWIQRQLNKL